MLLHVAKETAKNVVKGLFPTLVTRLRGGTGRGSGKTGEKPEEALAHGASVFDGYLKTLSLRREDLEGKTVVELGPGDTLATGLLFLAHGASSYTAVDRFAYKLETPFNADVYRLLREGLEPEARKRFDEAVQLSSGAARLDERRVKVVREAAESFRLAAPADLLVSAAVLEHVRDLDAVAERMSEALRAGGRMAHVVDLRDHDLYPGDPWRFLAYPPELWTVMHCFRGSPNRERLPRYLELLTRRGFDARVVEVLDRRSAEEVRAARPRLHPVFRGASDEDLAVMSFWLAAVRRG